MVFSIATEFIENEDENVDKQDCEINAFKRLQVQLKTNILDYPYAYWETVYMHVNQYLKYAKTTTGSIF